MTGTQQSGSGGNPSFETPKKSVGGVSQSKEQATATPGKGKTDPARNEIASPTEVRSRQENDREATTIEERSNAAAP